MKFRKKPVVIDAITFAELVQHGKDSGANIVRGMPWSFTYNRQAITHENDECYLILTLEGTMKFTPEDMLITGAKGEIYPCKLDIFNATYDAVPAAIEPQPPTDNAHVAPGCEQFSDGAIEQEIQAKGKTAPRVTPARIEEVIASEHYFTAQNGVQGEAYNRFDAGNYANPAPLRLLTFCVLILQNGFTVTGESACASPENFDAEIGRKIARDNAVNKIWLLEGYLLRQQLHERAVFDAKPKTGTAPM